MSIPALFFLGVYDMRVDKFLKASRIIKRRTVAKEACEGGRVDVNGRPAKAGTALKEGDVLELRFGASTMRVRIRELKENPRKEEAENLYEIIRAD